MLPEDNYRQKLLKGADEYDQYHLLLDSGYYKQQMRNMLQLNRGKNEKGDVVFSEIGQLAGVSNTDWSWSGLFADLNADGWKDLVITNGYLRDFTNLDFLKYTMSDAQLEAASKGNLNFKTYALAQKMPSNKLSNYIFLNNKDLTFSDVTKQSGFSIPSVSNAAAYADFDNDGDLDLIIGNNNEPVSLWKNNLTPSSRHWLSVQLKSESLNKFAFGAKVWVYQNGKVQYQELYPVRGYQSSVSPILYFGVAAQPVDSLIVQWPEGGRSALQNVEPDQMLSLKDQQAILQKQSPGKEEQKLFSDAPSSQQISFSHRENDFIDFKVEVLMPYQLSTMGPALATADVNNDGNDDVLIGGAIDQAGVLFLQNDDGSFIPSRNQPWDNDKQCEDVNALFFDADNDGDADLYVVSGGNEYMDESVEFQDRLYLNDGKGFFAKTIGALPNMKSNKHAIAAGDIDGDGDLDLFVGGRGKAGFYPLPSRSYVLINNTKDGKVSFTDATKTICSGLELPGMVTVALWSDVNNDKHPDLIIAGDLMPLMIFKNTAGTLVKESIPELESMSGIWSALQITDIDRDGDQDIVAGNIGNNTQFKITKQTPLTIYANDFDRDGNIDPIVCYYIQGKSYPMASRDELLDQIPSLKKKFVKYADYANATLETIFTKEQISASTVLKCTKAESVILLNQGNLKFEIRDLPVQVQFSKANSILADDVDGDNKTDLIVTGNFFSYRTQLGESDASVGMFLKGNGDGSFQSVTPQASGLFVSGDVRSAAHVKSKTGKERLVVVKNNSSPQVINIKP
jgi:enediyne biosynthesis protein E4